jgi:kumamolisin
VQLATYGQSSCSAAGNGGLLPNQLACAYNYSGLHNAGVQGQSQTVGVFELDGYSHSDIETYCKSTQGLRERNGGRHAPISPCNEQDAGSPCHAHSQEALMFLHYGQCFGGSSTPLQDLVLDGFNGQAGAGAVEVELDIELLLSMAPHLARVLAYEAANSTQGYNDEFARIVSDRTPLVSVSWGSCEKKMGQ